MGLGGLWWSNILDSALSPQRLRPDTQLEHQGLDSRMAWKKSKRKKKKTRTNRMPKEMVTAKLNRQNHTKKHTHTLTERETKK